MSDKQIGDSIRTYNPAPVEFNGFLLGEAVHDEEFIKGITEWACEMGKGSKCAALISTVAR